VKLDFGAFVCMLFICVNHSCVGFIMPLFAREYIVSCLLGEKVVNFQKSNNIMMTESSGRWRI